MRSSDWLSTGAAWWPEVSLQSLWDLDTASPSNAVALQRCLLARSRSSAKCFSVLLNCAFPS